MGFDLHDRRLDSRGFDDLLQFLQIDIGQADRPAPPSSTRLSSACHVSTNVTPES